MKVLLSRTDSIGDVVLTLPMAGLLKKYFPETTITFLGRAYTQPVVEKCGPIDHFLDWEKISDNQLGGFDYFIHVFPRREIAQKAKKEGNRTIIGTSHRWYHWVSCNRLVNLGRRKSDLHEAQLNLKLLEPIGIKELITTGELWELIHWKKNDIPMHPDLTDKFNLIFHPKSGGSAAEWPLVNYHELAGKLPGHDFQIFVTGTLKEKERILSECPKLFEHGHVSDMTGKLTLSELMDFIGQCDGALAGSTGPLHIASIAGLRTLGLYPSQRPMHPGRWHPIGPKSQVLTSAQTTSEISIPVDKVSRIIEGWVR